METAALLNGGEHSEEAGPKNKVGEAQMIEKAFQTEVISKLACRSEDSRTPLY